jgi:hypothetical protein
MCFYYLGRGEELMEGWIFRMDCLGVGDVVRGVDFFMLVFEFNLCRIFGFGVFGGVLRWGGGIEVYKKIKIISGKWGVNRKVIGGGG